ncbi:MAG: hypothetical protein ACOC10_10865, partial [Bacteroidota bacterium]
FVNRGRFVYWLSDDHIYIEKIDNSEVRIIIINSVGQLLFEGKSTEKLIKVDTYNFYPGIYTVELLSSTDRNNIRRCYSFVIE